MSAFLYVDVLFFTLNFFMRILKHFLLVMLFVAPLLLFSQTYANDNGRNPGNDGNRDRGKSTDNDRYRDRGDDATGSTSDSGDGARVPLDNGLVVLLAAGFAFGVKKIVDAKRLKVRPSYIQ
jgi:hypothetical protein